MNRTYLTKAAVAALVIVSAQAGAQTVVGLSTVNTIVTFDATNPGNILSSAAISGLQPGDTLQGIDFRPQTSEVIALGALNFMYSINPTSGVATPIGAGFTPGLDAGVRFGVDINPTVDRLRVVGSNAANRRLNPVTGGSVVTNGNPFDTALTFNPPQGAAPRAVSTSYTNSIFGAPVGSTRQFILDSNLNILGEVGSQAGGNASFNGGIITPVGALTLNGNTFDFDDNAGFDISGATGVAYVSLNVGTTPLAPTEFFTMNLATGQLTSLGSVGGSRLQDITIVPAPGVAGALGLMGLTLAARRRRVK